MLMWSDICFLLCVLRILQIRGTCTEMQNVFDEVILLAEKWGHLGKGLSMRRFLSYKCIVQHFRHDLCKKWFSYSMFLSCFPVSIFNISIFLNQEIFTWEGNYVRYFGKLNENHFCSALHNILTVVQAMHRIFCVISLSKPGNGQKFWHCCV